MDRDKLVIPRHIAIIMDGNGRWAKERGKIRLEGHRAGAASLERILYEELKDKFYNKKIESQHLLLPLKMEVTQIEKNIIFENINIFNDFGFDIDEFSENEIVIRAVPTFDFRDSIENVFLQLLLDLKNEVEIKDLRENIIISMSCKGAVKAGQKLDMFEMQNMVRRIHEVGKYTCPHGRPIIVKLSKNDLDKMFGRKK